jgi:DNA-directed RNA polymerase specialized sigma24 family protein
MTVQNDRAATEPAAQAVDDLYRAHALGLVRFALMLVGDQGTAEDVVQEAFLGLYRGWHRVRDPGNLLAYLRTAVLNGCRTVQRSRGRARLLRVTHDPPAWSAEAAALDGEDRRTVLADHGTLRVFIAAYDVTTGRQIRVLRTETTTDLSCGLTMDPSGSYLLYSHVIVKNTKTPVKGNPGVYIPTGHATTVTTAVNLATGRLSPLPIRIPGALNTEGGIAW